MPPRSATARVVGALDVTSSSPPHQLGPQQVTHIIRTLDGVRYPNAAPRRRAAKRKASAGKGSKKGHVSQPVHGRKGCADSHMVPSHDSRPAGLDGDGDRTPGRKAGDAGIFWFFFFFFHR